MSILTNVFYGTHNPMDQFGNNSKRQTWDRVDRYERIVVERIEAFHHY